jgi:alpha-L-rhamnosidase
VKIENVCINGIENPIGFSYEQLICSWNVNGADGKKQKDALIEVSTDAGFEKIIFKKHGENLCQSGEKLEVGLTPRTIYYYRVSVVADNGEKAVSRTHTFETGKMNEKWIGRWISPKAEDTFHPIMTKTFDLKPNGRVRRARLYICGVGLFEAYLNTEKIGEEYLTPYLNNYETGMQVITLPVNISNEDISEYNIKIVLGKGWYMGVFGLDLKDNMPA